MILTRDDFYYNHDTWTAIELYKYVRQLNILKLSHACILVTLTVPIAFLTCRKKVTTKRRYDNLLVLTLILELGYLMPLMFNIKKSLDLRKQINADLFSKWFFTLTEDTDVNCFGIYFMTGVTISIFTVTIFIQCLTCALTSSIKELETLRDKVQFDMIMDSTYDECDDDDDLELEDYNKVATN